MGRGTVFPADVAVTSTHDHISCSLYFNATRAIIILCYIPWGGEFSIIVFSSFRLMLYASAFSALRVLAMTKGHKPSTWGNKALAVIVFLLSMAPVIVNFVGQTPLLMLPL